MNRNYGVRRIGVQKPAAVDYNELKQQGRAIDFLGGIGRSQQTLYLQSEGKLQIRRDYEYVPGIGQQKLKSSLYDLNAGYNYYRVLSVINQQPSQRSGGMLGNILNRGGNDDDDMQGVPQLTVFPFTQMSTMQNMIPDFLKIKALMVQFHSKLAREVDQSRYDDYWAQAVFRLYTPQTVQWTHPGLQAADSWYLTRGYDVTDSDFTLNLHTGVCQLNNSITQGLATQIVPSIDMVYVVYRPEYAEFMAKHNPNLQKEDLGTKFFFRANYYGSMGGETNVQFRSFDETKKLYDDIGAQLPSNMKDSGAYSNYMNAIVNTMKKVMDENEQKEYALYSYKPGDQFAYGQRDLIKVKHFSFAERVYHVSVPMLDGIDVSTVRPTSFTFTQTSSLKWKRSVITTREQNSVLLNYYKQINGSQGFKLGQQPIKVQSRGMAPSLLGKRAQMLESISDVSMASFMSVVNKYPNSSTALEMRKFALHNVSKILKIWDVSDFEAMGLRPDVLTMSHDQLQCLWISFLKYLPQMTRQTDISSKKFKNMSVYKYYFQNIADACFSADVISGKASTPGAIYSAYGCKILEGVDVPHEGYFNQEQVQFKVIDPKHPYPGQNYAWTTQETNQNGFSYSSWECFTHLVFSQKTAFLNDFGGASNIYNHASIYPYKLSRGDFSNPGEKIQLTNYLSILAGVWSTLACAYEMYQNKGFQDERARHFLIDGQQVFSIIIAKLSGQDVTPENFQSKVEASIARLSSGAAGGRLPSFIKDLSKFKNVTQGGFYMDVSLLNAAGIEITTQNLVLAILGQCVLQKLRPARTATQSNKADKEKFRDIQRDILIQPAFQF